MMSIVDIKSSNNSVENMEPEGTANVIHQAATTSTTADNRDPGIPRLPKNISQGLKSELGGSSAAAARFTRFDEADEEGDSVADLPRIPKKLHQPLLESDDESVRIAVFLKRDRNLSDEGASYIIELEKEKNTTASDIKMKMMELLSLPPAAAQIFAIWFVSPYLELQLKPQHKVFIMRRQWIDLLTKYSLCPEEELGLDEPIVMFQRNSYISLAEEVRHEDYNVLKLLFEEATFNVLTARYPVPVADAEMLAGIVLKFYEGDYDPEFHRTGVLIEKLNNLLPYYAIGSNKISQYIHSSSTEHHLIQQYQMANAKLDNEMACCQEYLKYCRRLAFYGSAFFFGKCKQEGANYKIWKSAELEITVALNRFGITFFKTDTDEMLAHLLYAEMAWDCKDAESDEEEGKPIGSLVIEYDGENGPRQIQIISPQAKFMDAMAQSCVQFIKESGERQGDLDKGDRTKLSCISYDAVGAVV